MTLKQKISKILEDFNNDDKHLYEDRLKITLTQIVEAVKEEILAQDKTMNNLLTQLEG